MLPSLLGGGGGGSLHRHRVGILALAAVGILHADEVGSLLTRFKEVVAEGTVLLGCRYQEAGSVVVRTLTEDAEVPASLVGRLLRQLPDEARLLLVGEVLAIEFQGQREQIFGSWSVQDYF